MTLTHVPENRRCNAKTRAGTPCKNWSILPAARCRMHGGRSRRGIASPRFKHGWYSNDILCRIWRLQWEREERIRRYVERALADRHAER